jgi:hypothetical protein
LFEDNNETERPAAAQHFLFCSIYYKQSSLSLSMRKPELARVASDDFSNAPHPHTRAQGPLLKLFSLLMFNIQ